MPLVQAVEVPRSVGPEMNGERCTAAPGEDVPSKLRFKFVAGLQFSGVGFIMCEKVATDFKS